MSDKPSFMTRLIDKVADGNPEFAQWINEHKCVFALLCAMTLTAINLYRRLYERFPQ